ncbi:MAG: excalibur calcium-binding domain-containing protein [Tropicimonas sp.]|uniref:excalibur calcium-binding domain-containing protein n=1 Tax=Tropicimonas sp. TaxID=2067044 RepID=UPI003A875219
MRVGVVLSLLLITTAATAEPRIVVPARPDVRDALLQLAAAYDCSDKSCKQMSSCDEACYKLVVCGQKKRDGDNDGIPCENVCSARCE